MPNLYPHQIEALLSDLQIQLEIVRLRSRELLIYGETNSKGNMYTKYMPLDKSYAYAKPISPITFPLSIFTLKEELSYCNLLKAAK